MNSMTKQQVMGTKFEIWLAQLISGIVAEEGSRYFNVMRNVEYHKSRYIYRQADVSYNLISKGQAYLALVEAKFSSGGLIHYNLRQGTKKKNGCSSGITNLVDEVYERQCFVGASFSILATNTDFEGKVKEEAAKKGIKIANRQVLQGIYNSQGGKGSIDDAIYSVSLKGKCHKNMIYI